MTTLEKIREEIEQKMSIKPNEFNQHDESDYDRGLGMALFIIDKYAEQDKETTVSILPDENGYYPNVCGMCANAESELCDWCGGNNNFKKTTTKIPDFYKKYAEQEPSETMHGSIYGGVSWGGTCKPKEPMREFTEEEAESYSKALDKMYKPTGFNVFNGPCDDAISRKSIKYKLQEKHDFFVNAYGEFSNLPQNEKARVDEITNCIAMVVNEPPVRPQEPKTGHWIRQDNTKEPLYGWYFCSECNSVIGDKTKFCSNCGANMVEPQESEDKG